MSAAQTTTTSAEVRFWAQFVKRAEERGQGKRAPVAYAPWRDVAALAQALLSKAADRMRRLDT